MTQSPEETKALAADLAKNILAHGAGKKATVVTLEGDLGAGKTTFTQGFFKGLGVKRVPASPTFILMRRTRLRSPRRAPAGKPTFKNVFHIDAYRLRGAPDQLGLKALLESPENLLLIEWPDRVKAHLPRTTLRIKFAHGRREHERRMSIPGRLQ